MVVASIKLNIRFQSGRVGVLHVRPDYYLSRVVHMDQYRRVDVPKEQEDISDNEIRVTQAGKVRKYISYATQMLQVRLRR